MAYILLLILAGGAGALLLWLVLEPVFVQIARRLERILPDDIIGPDAWYIDTSGRRGIFDRGL